MRRRLLVACRLALDLSAAEHVIDIANVVREPAPGGESAADEAGPAGLLDALAYFAAAVSCADCAR